MLIFIFHALFFVSFYIFDIFFNFHFFFSIIIFPRIADFSTFFKNFFSRTQWLIEEIQQRSAPASLIQCTNQLISKSERSWYWNMVVNKIDFFYMNTNQNHKSKSNNDYQKSHEPGPISKIRLRSALRITFAVGVSYVGFLESLLYLRTVVTIRLFL